MPEVVDSAFAWAFLQRLLADRLDVRMQHAAAFWARNRREPAR
jgi:hypothetical protein